MGSGIGFFLMFMMMLAGGPNGPQDMLDMVPTEAYWQSKHVTPSVEQLEKDAGPDAPVGDAGKLIAALGADDFKTREAAAKELEGMGPAVLPLLKPAMESKDPEVVSAVTALSKKLAATGKAREVRRLMAIRTLGEVKAKASEPTLKLLLDSKDNFVAEYAARAIAQIEGKPLPKMERKSIAQDLKLLPKEVGIVGQFRGMSGTPLTMELMASEVLAQMQERPNMMGMKAEDLPDNKKLTTLITAKLLEVVEQVGDIRIDGMTLGVAEDVGPNSGWAMMVFHGKGDRAAFLAGIRSTGREEGEKENGPTRRYRPEMKVSHEEGIDIIEVGQNEVYVVPSDDTLIVIGGPNPEKIKEGKDLVVAAIKSGKGDLEKNEELGALMSKVDTNGPLWVVGKLSPAMQQMPLFQSIDTFTLTSKQGKESMSFTLSGQGTDAEKVKASADMMSEFVQAGTAAMKEKAEKVKEMGAVVELLESAKVTAEGNTASMSGEAKPGVVHWFMGESPMAWIIMNEMRSNRELMKDAGPDATSEPAGN